jgi:6-phosphogluconate dehydrogenase (decarboxylating)
MQIGVIGLGRIGGNIVRRLARAGHTSVVYDTDPAPGAALAKEGATAAPSLQSLVETLQSPRTAWMMLPTGKITEDTIATLARLMKPGDTIIDGGNTNFEEAVPTDVLAASLFVRFRSRQQHNSRKRFCRRCGSASAATSSHPRIKICALQRRCHPERSGGPMAAGDIRSLAAPGMTGFLLRA